MRTPHLLASLLLFGTSLLAQSTRVVPGFAAGVDGNDQSWFPFVYDKTLVQQLWDGSTICTANALLTQMRVRRDHGDPQVLNGYTIANLDVRLGYSAATPASMTTTFATNRAGALTTVFSGPYSPPTQPAPNGATGAFNVGWVFTAPFVYVKAQGNLLFEFEIAGQAGAKNRYPVDAVRTNAAGAATKYGTSGGFGTQEAFSLDCTSPGASLVPGGSATLAVTGLKSAYPTLLVLGISKSFYAAYSLVLPFDLGPFNAVGNSIYASPETLSAFPIIPQGTTFGGSVTLPIPPQQGLAAQSVYTQLLSLDPSANGIGVVLSQGLQLDLGSPSHFTQTLGASSSTQATGFFWFGSTGDAGGPVVQFSGTFN